MSAISDPGAPAARLASSGLGHPGLLTRLVAAVRPEFRHDELVFDPGDPVLLAATVFAHESAALGVHVLAGLGGDLRLEGRLVCRAGVGSGCAEEAGERGDGFEQQGVEAGLLVGGAAGAEFGDGAAVLGLGGELADPGGQGGVLQGGRAARRDAAASRG